MRYRPIRDQVLVELDPFNYSFGDSGLIRPDTATDKPMVGTVRAIGNGRITKKGVKIPVTVAVGDRVMVPWSTGHDLFIGNKLFVSVHDSDIVAQVEGE